MRAGIGLVSILVCAGIAMYWFAETQIPIAKVGKQAQGEAQQISGRGQDGESAMESFATDAEFSGSRLRALAVTKVNAGGAMQTWYGMQVGDRITGIGGTRLSDVSNNDDGMAKALVAEAFQKRQTLDVQRDGQAMTLPAPAGQQATAPGAAAAAGSPGGTPPGAAPAPAPSPDSGTSPLGNQLKAIEDAAAQRGQ
jgi:hypothetical protein